MLKKNEKFSHIHSRFQYYFTNVALFMKFVVLVEINKLLIVTKTKKKIERKKEKEKRKWILTCVFLVFAYA